MADFSKPTALNKAGKYYVDGNCICCGICTLIAPENIFISIEKEYGYIGKQPETPEEINAMIKAIQNCPVNAIGEEDGKSGLQV